MVIEVIDPRKSIFVGQCPRCKKKNCERAWCNSCDRNALIDGFNSWSTGNECLNRFIQQTQRTATCYELPECPMMKSYLEYIPFNRFNDVKPLEQGRFNEMFTATWQYGKREASNISGKDNWIKSRSKSLAVTLKMIKNSGKMDQSFVDELDLYYQLYCQSTLFYKCHGITHDPETKNYALVLENFPDSNLQSLINSNNKLDWKDKLSQLRRICYNLMGIHKKGYLHRDIHSGNILIRDNVGCLTDSGLVRQADLSRSKTGGTHGAIPYTAPELFRGEPHSKATDIYAIGIVMTEYASQELAFGNRDHDTHLQLDIIDGLRPEVPQETPECYVQLLNQCLSENPLNRPTAERLWNLFLRWSNDLCDNKDTTETIQFKAADRRWKPRERKEKHPGAIYTSRFIFHVSADKKEEVLDNAATAQNVPIISAQLSTMLF